MALNPFTQPDPQTLEFDPQELRFHTNYSATGLIDVIKSGNKARAKRQKQLTGMLDQLSRMHPPRFSSGPGSGAPNMGKSNPGSIHAGSGTVKGKERFRALVKAIWGKESGGNYQAVNSSSGAAGRYQIMPGNFVGKGGWDVEALGRNVSLQQFMKNPRIQDRIAQHKLREYYHQYGARGAAQAWYGGPGAVGNNNISGGSGYPSTGEYANDIIARMRRIMNRR